MYNQQAKIAIGYGPWKMILVIKARIVEANMYDDEILDTCRKAIPRITRSTVTINNSSGNSRKFLVLF
jgi:hypothetical protein